MAVFAIIFPPPKFAIQFAVELPDAFAVVTATPMPGGEATFEFTLARGGQYNVAQISDRVGHTRINLAPAGTV